MKILSILFLVTFSLLREAHSASFADRISLAVALAPVDKAERDLKEIKIRTQNPMLNIEQNLQSYSELMAIFEAFKNYDLKFTGGLLTKIRTHDTLSGDELFVLRRTITTYYKINEKILEFAKLYDYGEIKLSTALADNGANIPLIKAHLIWLSGHLLVLDHLENMHAILYKSDSVFRRIVKKSLLEKGNTASEVSKTLNDLIKMNEYTTSKGESRKFIQQINFVRAVQDELRSVLAKELPALELANTIINNPTAIAIAQGKTKFKIDHYTVIDSVVGTFDRVTGWLSSIFGNVAGSIKWRKGHMYNNQLVSKITKRNLKPMDILVEKSPFVLTDKFIPGYYGHIAIYLGTKDQLESIGMWNHPDIIPYHKEIAAGKVILEAVRIPGVHLNTLEEFLNIDELAIIRKNDALSNEDILVDEIARGMEQIGKKYDFNFDISTLNEIVCSELIYIFYGTVHWPTQYRFGRPTITPDNAAEILFQKNTKFNMIKSMSSTEDNQVDQLSIKHIADELEYELRSSNGDPIKDPKDPTNSYFKKETKCYNNVIKRICKTNYKEFYYEEKDAI